MNSKEFFRLDDSMRTDRLVARESLVMNVTEDLLVALEDQGISQKELARRLGKSKSFVSQVLSGARNMTLATLSNFAHAMGYTVVVRFMKKTTEPAVVVPINGPRTTVFNSSVGQPEESVRVEVVR